MVTIPQLAASKVRHTLGVCLAPDGNDELEYQYLVEVARKWQLVMTMAKVSHLAAEFGL